MRKISHKRLKRNSRGSIILPNGQRITPKEQKALKSAVVSANRKRRAMIEKLPQQAKERYKDFGVESDFVLRKKSARFNRFRNKGEFNRYLKSIQKINASEYIKNKVETYRSNYLRSIDKVYNSTGQPIKEFINSLSADEFRELSLSGELEDIGYIYYAPVSVKNKLDKLNSQIRRIRKKYA